MSLTTIIKETAVKIKLLVSSLLVAVLVKTAMGLLSFPVGKPNLAKELVYQERNPLRVPYSGDPVFSKQSTPTKDWRQLVDKDKIAPAIYRKIPINKDVSCKECNAPARFILSYGKDPVDGSQKYLCKVCRYQWSKRANKRQSKYHPTIFCPWCGYALVLKHQRKEFDVFICRYKHCPHKVKSFANYSFRGYKFTLSDLIPTRLTTQQNLANTRFSDTVVLLALILRVNAGLSSYETARLLKELFGVRVSHQTILRWEKITAYLVQEKFVAEKISCSAIWVVDETYVRIGGRWWYLFVVLDKEGKLLSFHMSKTRSTKAAVISLFSAYQKTGIVPKQLVTDGYIIYPLALAFLKQAMLKEKDITFNPVHHQVLGLKDQIPQEFRPLKQLIERFFSTVKGRARRARGYKTQQGYLSFFTLFACWYNWLRPHQSFGGLPPMGKHYQKRSALLSWKRVLGL